MISDGAREALQHPEERTDAEHERRRIDVGQREQVAPGAGEREQPGAAWSNHDTGRTGWSRYHFTTTLAAMS